MFLHVLCGWYAELIIDLHFYMCFAEFILYLKDKAHWNDDNTHVFCTLAVEHKRRGFMSKGSMTKRGFLSMAP